jgi:hypothetical protein
MRPAAVDWDGDGLMDLVTGYQGPRDRNDGPDIAVSLFRRYRDKNGALRLGKPEVFRMEDGSELRTPIPYCHGFEVVDWDGDGDYDLLMNQKSQLVLYRNVGSNARPRFRRELLKMYGQPISVSHHESSLKAVDWDKDGKLDLVVGGESGYVFFLRRAALEAEAAPKYTLGAPEVIGR